MAAQGRDIKLSTAARRGLPQLRDQAVERRALRRDERLRDASTASIRKPPRRRSTAGSRTRRRRPRPRSTEAIDAYTFNEAAGAVYRFVWNIYCDWYLELAKPVLTGADGAAKDETRATVAWVRDEILKLLHPFMPFITEELWAHDRRAGPSARQLLALAPNGRNSTALLTPTPRPRSAGSSISSPPSARCAPR